MRRNGSLQPWTMGLVWLAAGTCGVQAGEIYKSVDADGHVVYSDHADPSRPQTTVVLRDAPRYPPPEIHVCGTQNCFTLMLDNGSYRRADGTDDTWAIDTFTATSVVLHRHGAPTGSADMTYSGDVVHDRLINVKVNGTPLGGIDASWGAALNTLPGSNAERDAGNPAPSAGDTVNTTEVPPPVPDEDQAAIPEPGYLWTPGVWAWGRPGFFWVPGAWRRPPHPGSLWTPAFWAVAGTVFVFHRGYWGPAVGYYGGIDYGHGYFGNGYAGGRWVGNQLSYNSNVNRLGPAVKNTYSEPPPKPAVRAEVQRSAGSNTPVAVTAASTVTIRVPPAVQATAGAAAPPKAVHTLHVIRVPPPRL